MVRRLCLGVVLVVLFTPLLTSAASPGDITSLVPNTLYASTPERGVFKRPDGGGTWTATCLTNTPAFALAIDPGVPSLLYAVTPSGLLTSVNGR